MRAPRCPERPELNLQEVGSAGQAEKAKLNSESRIGRHTGSPDSDRAQIVTLHGFSAHVIGARREQHLELGGQLADEVRFVELVNWEIVTRNETKSSSGAWLPDAVW